MQEIYRRNPHKYFLREIWDDEEDAIENDDERTLVIDTLNLFMPKAKKKGGYKSQKKSPERKTKN